MLRTAFYAMKRDPGVDGMTWETYERDLDRQIGALHERVKSGAYRALPSRRSYIPKEDAASVRWRSRPSKTKSFREPWRLC
jgi:RNA-directed DNA polymerase